MDKLSEIELKEYDKVLLYDGVCVFCNNSVDYVIKNEKKSVIRFVPLQSEVGKRILNHFDYPLDYLGSILFLESGKIMAKSSAALAVSKYLKLPTSLLQVFWIVPAFIRDVVYNFIGQNRYKWFGRSDACRVPTPELQSRFIEA